jgi:copper(I)-binding protein
VSRTLRRGAVAAVIVAIAPVLAACSAGSSAATLQVKPNSAATSLSNGQLKINGVEVVTDARGNAPANVVANIANNESQQETLVSVTVGGTAATLSGSGAIDTQASLILAGPNNGNIQATVPTLGQPAGSNVPVTFVFANAGSVTVDAQIQTGTGEYTSYAPAAPVPTTSPLAHASTAAHKVAQAHKTGTKPETTNKPTTTPSTSPTA